MLGISRLHLILDGHDTVMKIDPNSIFELKALDNTYMNTRYTLLQENPNIQLSFRHFAKRIKNIKKVNWKQQGF